MDSTWDIQTAVYDLLTGETDITSQLADGANSVFDHVPPGSAFPYIVIGDTSARPLDTQGHVGREVTVDIHTYSRQSGAKELKHIMAAIFEALHNADFEIENQALILCQELSFDTFLESDGETRRGLQRFRLITEPV